jgi:hypothetical protein
MADNWGAVQYLEWQFKSLHVICGYPTTDHRLQRSISRLPPKRKVVDQDYEVCYLGNVNLFFYAGDLLMMYHDYIALMSHWLINVDSLWNKNGRGKPGNQKKKAPVSLCPLQIPHDMTWDQSVLYQNNDVLLNHSQYY